MSPPFAVMISALHHEQVQDLGRYAIAPPGNVALHRYYPKRVPWTRGGRGDRTRGGRGGGTKLGCVLQASAQPFLAFGALKLCNLLNFTSKITTCLVSNR